MTRSPSPTRRDFLRRGSLGLAATAAAGGWLLRPDVTAATEPSGALGDYAPHAGDGHMPVVADAQPTTDRWAATQDNILGPYHRPGAPFRAKVTPPLAEGRILLVTGRVWALDARKPLPQAVLDVWQADHHGRYDNDDPKNPPAKGVFKYRARLVCDEAGHYEYETIYPGKYKTGPDDWRPAHIHYLVRAPGYKTLVTQLYFKGDPHNATDPFIQKSLIIELGEVKVGAQTYAVGTFDIVLAKE